MNLSFRDIGSGEPIVFLHAFPLNQRMWDEQVNDLSSSYRVITLDLPGFGGSPPDDSRSEVGIDRFAFAVLYLLDSLAIDRFHLCGLSMGGYVALAVYRLGPERIRSLTLCDTRATADSDDARKGRYETVEIIKREGIKFLALNMTKRLLGETTLSEQPNIVEQVSRMILTSSTAGIIQALTAMAERPDSSALILNMGVGFDLLVIVGEEDRLSPPDEMRTLALAVPGAKMGIIPLAGHLPNIEQPQRFNDTLREFLQSARRA